VVDMEAVVMIAVREINLGVDHLTYAGGLDYRSSGAGGSSSYGGGGRDQERQYDEYDAGDWEDAPRRSTTVTPSRSASMNTTTNRPTASPAPAAPPPAKAPAVNLLDFGDDEPAAAPAPVPAPAVARPTAPVAPAVSLDGIQFNFNICAAC
jgi:epsin